MSDIDNPFCPLPKERLLFNVENDKHKIEKIIEKIQILMTIFTPQKNKSGSVIGAAISAGYSALRGGAGGRVIVITCNNCNKGYGSSKVTDSFNLFGTENEKNLYNPQVRIIIKKE